MLSQQNEINFILLSSDFHFAPRYSDTGSAGFGRQFKNCSPSVALRATLSVLRRTARKSARKEIFLPDHRSSEKTSQFGIVVRLRCRLPHSLPHWILRPSNPSDSPGTAPAGCFACPRGLVGPKGPPLTSSRLHPPQAAGYGPPGPRSCGHSWVLLPACVPLGRFL